MVWEKVASGMPSCTFPPTIRSSTWFHATSWSLASNRARALGMALVAARSRVSTFCSPSADISDAAAAVARMPRQMRVTVTP